jgi:DNA-binding LacI/PurR family transcriptional regulator
MANLPHADGSRTRVTMRGLARLAGVSAQAVSLALRNHPSIGEATRRRIRQVAQRAGYRPDPQVAKLMHHLRAGRGQRPSANVCALTTRPAGVREAFCDLLLQGAVVAAQAAGFSLQVIHVDGAASARRRLPQILRSRGVEGLILLPMAKVEGLDDLLDWREFSVVGATLSVTSPRFDSVAANHFQNVFNLCEHLRNAGYRRPGLVIHPKHDARCGHNITAAHAWHGIYGNLELARAHRCERLEPAALRRWLEQEKPDVLLAEQDELAHALRRERALVGDRWIVSCSARPLANGQFAFSGNHERPEQIGATAVEVLTRMVTIGKRGIPAHPQMTLVDGTWVDGQMAGAAAPPGKS